MLKHPGNARKVEQEKHQQVHRSQNNHSPHEATSEGQHDPDDPELSHALYGQRETDSVQRSWLLEGSQKSHR